MSIYKGGCEKSLAKNVVGLGQLMSVALTGAQVLVIGALIGDAPASIQWLSVCRIHLPLKGLHIHSSIGVRQ